MFFCCPPQLAAQAQVISQQQARLSDLEASAKQWEARCQDLRGMASGHEARAKEAASEVLKGNAIIERLQVSQGKEKHGDGCRDQREGAAGRGARIESWS